MLMNALDAVTAYGRQLGAGAVGKATNGEKMSAAAGQTADFGALMQNALTSTADTLRSAEEASAKQVAGQGDLIDVVTAISAAEVALDTMVAVRDKMVNAYTEIMRMQI